MISNISRRALLPLLGSVLVAPSVFSKSLAAKRFTFREVHMGMVARITLYADHTEHAREAVKAAFQVIRQVDQALSHFSIRSEAMNLKVENKVSDHLYQNLKTADHMYGLTDGIFDVALGPLTKVWHQARKNNQFPSKFALLRAKQKSGWKGSVSLSAHNKVHIHRDGLHLDFGGLGKGYAADQAQLVLQKLGITSAMVEIGGDVVVSNPPEDTKGWRISLGNEKIKQFKNIALSTTGNSQQFLDHKNIRYSHVLRASNGMAVSNHRALTVVGENGQLADALATTLGMLDNKEGDNFAANHFKTYKVYEV
ncbi:MAG: FAD:protein FMN transferase [Kordiimonadaceae bacterium]|jgi:FAD:protein FMN transferase|nr:FAD:protein FMN transferase [Kordiimonadaceae bacterium]